MRGGGGAGGDEGGGDRASTNVPIAPRDAFDGRVSGLVFSNGEQRQCTTCISVTVYMMFNQCQNH